MWGFCSPRTRNRRVATGLLVYLGRSGVHETQRIVGSVLSEPSITSRDLAAYFKSDDVRVESEELLAARGENSRLSRLVLSNGAKLVVKRRPEAESARRVASIQRWYEREVYWYSKLAPETKEVRCPACVAARYDSWTGAFTLVLEDLSEAWSPLGTDKAALVAAARTLGRLHKRWRGVSFPRLPRTPVHLELASQIEVYFVAAWRHVKYAPHFTFEDNVSDLVDALARDGRYASLVSALAASPNATLLHGDFRPANLRRQGDTICVFDWQFLSTGAGAYDLAYFLGLAAHPHDRRLFEADVRQAYLDELGQPSLLPSDLEAAVLLALASFVMGAHTTTDVHTHQLGIDYLAAAALDWGFRG